MSIVKHGSTLLIAAMLLGCAQQEEPATMVSLEPVFDKYGGGSCDDGYTYVPGTASTPPICEPDDCVETSVPGAAAIPCPPPSRRPDDNRDDDSTPTGNPTFTRP